MAPDVIAKGVLAHEVVTIRVAMVSDNPTTVFE
jgi:hypothetical protein